MKRYKAAIFCRCEQALRDRAWHSGMCEYEYFVHIDDAVNWLGRQMYIGQDVALQARNNPCKPEHTFTYGFTVATIKLIKEQTKP